MPSNNHRFRWCWCDSGANRYAGEMRTLSPRVGKQYWNCISSVSYKRMGSWEWAQLPDMIVKLSTRAGSGVVRDKTQFSCNLYNKNVNMTVTFIAFEKSITNRKFKIRENMWGVRTWLWINVLNWYWASHKVLDW